MLFFTGIRYEHSGTHGAVSNILFSCKLACQFKANSMARIIDILMNSAISCTVSFTTVINIKRQSKSSAIFEYVHNR